MAADIFEEFEPPSKPSSFLATPLDLIKSLNQIGVMNAFLLK